MTRSTAADKRLGRQTLGLATLTIVALILTSCSSESVTESQPSPTSNSTTSTAATPTNATENSVTSGPIVSTGKVEFMQAGISPNDPALKLDDSKVTSAAKTTFSESDLQESYKVAAIYTATEFIDSTINSETGDVSTWWTKNQSRFDSEYASKIKSDIESLDVSLIFKKPSGHANLYTYIYDKSSPRVIDREIKPDSIDIVSGNGRTAVFIKNNVVWITKIKMADGSQGTQVNKGYLQLSLLKDDTGSWKIAGYNSYIDSGTST